MTRTRTESGGEAEPLIVHEGDEEHHYEGPNPPNPYADLPIYTTIHRVRRELIDSIDDPYSLDQLRAPRINVAIVRPLVDRLWDDKDVSIIYCLLVNKIYFLREQAFEAHQTITTTRAHLCELAAAKMLRRFDEHNPGRDGLLLLAHILVAGFEPFQNAPKEIQRVQSYATSSTVVGRGHRIGKSTVLEMAIISESKIFLSAPACQKVIEAIYVGRVVYTPSSFIDIIPDHYKYKPITLYYPKKALVLNQYRLMVPRTRNALDICQFSTLLILYILAMEHRNHDEFTKSEIFYCIYATGWALDEFASILEHGWKCYTQNLWAFLDFTFILIHLVYFVLRFYSLVTGGEKSGTTALDILSAAAPVLIPRLAFNLLSENMLFVSLRAMIADFAVLTMLAMWCFAGFLLSLMWVGKGNHPPITISKWMLFVWFGLDGTGIQKSVEFHWLIGPILMVTFAFLGNTLFLTILVSMLSNTFSKIASNVAAEIQYRRAVLTFEGVKSDAIFNYQPPFNILALLILLPLKMALTPRWFHKINVAAVRTINGPLLLAINVYERKRLWATKPMNILGKLSSFEFSRFSVHADIQAVFDSDPPQYVQDEITEAEEDPKSREPNGRAASRSEGKHKGPPKQARRKDSMAAMDGSAEHVGDGSHGHDNSELVSRLEALENATRRIEHMVKRIGQDLGSDSSGSESSRSQTADDINENTETGRETEESGDVPITGNIKR